MNNYKQEMERLENLFNIFQWSVKPSISDIENIIQFFNDNNSEEYDLRDAKKCAKRIEELMSELEEEWEENYNYSEY